MNNIKIFKSVFCYYYMTLRPRIRNTLPYTPQQKPQVSQEIPRAELVYVTCPPGQGYLALRDSTGEIYLLQRNFSLSTATINPLRDNYLLLLLQDNIIRDVRERLSQSEHRGLEKLFRGCVKNLPIKKAVFNIPSIL